jgi:hypothetical protein
MPTHVLLAQAMARNQTQPQIHAQLLKAALPASAHVSQQTSLALCIWLALASDIDRSPVLKFLVRICMRARASTGVLAIYTRTYTHDQAHIYIYSRDREH